MKQTLLALFTVFTISVIAQEKPLISDAVLSVDTRNDIVMAKDYIDQAGVIIDKKGGVSDDPKQTSKYLYYKGKIYYRLSISEDPAIKNLDPNAVEIAADSYLKLLEFEKQVGKERYTDKALSELPYVAQSINARAYERYEASDFIGAADDFIKTYELKKNPALGETRVSYDSTSYYYAGVMYNLAGDTAKALEILINVLEMGYNGYTYTATIAESDQSIVFPTRAAMDQKVEAKMVVNPEVGPSFRPDIYKTLIAIYLAKGDKESFGKYLAMARVEYPSDISLINMELQGYLNAEDYAKALEVLDMAIEKDPTNSIYYYVQGFIYQNDVKDGDKALVAYQKALDLDPTNFDCWFSSGKVWYDRGKETIDQMNKLGLSSADQKKYDKLKVQKEDLFGKATPYFEKAHAVNAEDREAVTALWECYRQTNNYEKAKEMKDLLDAMSTDEGKTSGGLPSTPEK